MGVFRRQIGALDTHVHHFQAIGGQQLAGLLHDLAHNDRAFLRDHVKERVLAKGHAQLGVNDIVQAGVGPAHGAQGAVKQEGIGDAPAGVVVNDQILFIQCEHLSRLGVVFEQTGVKIDHVLDKRNLDMQSRGHGTGHGFAELQHNGRLGLVHHIHRLGSGDEAQEKDHGPDHEGSFHCAPPLGLAAGVGWPDRLPWAGGASGGRAAGRTDSSGR